MGKTDQYQEIFSQILSAHGIKIPKDQRESICSDFVEAIEYNSEFDFVPPAPRPDNPLDNHAVYQLRELAKEIEVFKDSVKTRRGCERVWVENGDVKYS